MPSAIPRALVSLLLLALPVIAAGQPRDDVALLDLPSYDVAAAAERLTIDGVRMGDRTVRLELQRTDPFTSGARVVVGTAAGDVPVERPAVATFSGRVVGAPARVAYLSISPFGTYGVIATDQTVHLISTGRFDDPQLPVLFDAASLPPGSFDPSQMTCHSDELPIVTPPIDPPQGGVAAGAPCRQLNLAVETDWEFTGNLFGGNTAASSAYATSLIAAMSAIYTRDVNTRIAIGYLRVWADANDPWDQPDTGSQLTQFLNYWNANMQAVPRHLAHFLSGRGLGGGVAYLSVICNGTYGYGLSANLGGWFPYPLQDHHWGTWDLFVVAHELGHNFGAPHTHDMTPPVDGCGLGDCSDAANGTIMSYCHGCAGGMSNILLKFHVRTIAETMLPYLDSTCDISATPLPGSSLSFDGVNDNVRMAGFGNGAPTTEVTIEFWQLALDKAGRSSFGLNPDAVQNRIQAHVPWADGIVYWDFGNINAGGRLSYTPPEPIVDSWQHFAFVASQSGNFMRIFRNGVLEAEQSGMSPFTQGNYGLRIGSLASGNYFAGRIDEFRVWNVARSPAEIAANYTGTLSGNEPGLLHYWRLDEGSGSTVVDSAGTLNGTLFGPSWATNVECVSGACCFLDGTCLQVTAADCGYLGGSYRGDGTSCGDPCPRPGACCLPPDAGGVCNVMLPDDCAALGGTFLGEDTTCDPAVGPFSGHALHFDGVNDYVSIGNPDELNFPGQITLEAWIRPEATDGLRNIVMHGYRTNPDGETGMRINSGVYEVFRWSGTQKGASFAVPPEDIGHWVHLAGVYDGAWKLYRNGELVATGTDNIGAVVMNAKWAIGARGSGTERFFAGDIDEVRIWNIGRSAADVAAHYKSLLSGSEAGLVGYWRLDEGTGLVAEDLAGVNDGALTGGVAWTATAPCLGACDPCDTNCDGSVNGQDVENFLAALGGAPSGCSPCNSDTNGDGSINGFDISAFVACLSGP